MYLSQIVGAVSTYPSRTANAISLWGPSGPDSRVAEFATPLPTQARCPEKTFASAGFSPHADSVAPVASSQHTRR